jgi:hypothetical protein
MDNRNHWIFYNNKKGISAQHWLLPPATQALNQRFSIHLLPLHAHDPNFLTHSHMCWVIFNFLMCEWDKIRVSRFVALI